MKNEDCQGYRKLHVWQKSQELAFQIYELSKRFPKDEQFGLTSQLRRAALSVPTNIAEGMGRQGRNETRQFLNIALGSLSEMTSLLDFAVRMGHIDGVNALKIEKDRQEIGAMLWVLFKKF